MCEIRLIECIRCSRLCLKAIRFALVQFFDRLLCQSFEMTYADVIASCMFNDTFSDDESMVMCGGSDITDEPFPEPYYDDILEDHVFPVYINHDGEDKRYYLPLNGDVETFVLEYFNRDDLHQKYFPYDYYVECGNQTWHFDDPPASWGNLQIASNMTIFFELESVPH